MILHLYENALRFMDGREEPLEMCSVTDYYAEKAWKRADSL